MKWGEEKRALLGSFFLIEFFSTASSSVCIFFLEKVYTYYIYKYILTYLKLFLFYCFSRPMFIVLVTTSLFRMFIQGSSFAARVCLPGAAATF